MLGGPDGVRLTARSNLKGVVCTAVVQGEPVTAKTALTGSLVFSCPTAFGTYLLSGGVAQHTINAQLLVVSLESLILPTAFHIFASGTMKPRTQRTQLCWRCPQTEQTDGLMELSHESAVVPIAEFLCYMYCFYWTHVDMREDSAARPYPRDSYLLPGHCFPLASRSSRRTARSSSKKPSRLERSCARRGKRPMPSIRSTTPWSALACSTSRY